MFVTRRGFPGTSVKELSVSFGYTRYRCQKSVLFIYLRRLPKCFASLEDSAGLKWDSIMFMSQLQRVFCCGIALCVQED